MSKLDFALWISGKEKKASNKFKSIIKELHINCWKIGNDNCLDFGILLDGRNNRALNSFYVNLFIPALLSDFEIYDLSGAFDKSTASALFNEPIKVEDILCNSRLKRISFYSDKKPIYVVSFDINSSDQLIKKDIRRENGEKAGALISFIINSSFLNSKFLPYIRFRLKGTFINEAYTMRPLKEYSIESIYTVYSLFDISINRYRKLPNYFISNDNYKYLIYPKIDKVHFLLMTYSNETLELSIKPCDNVQLLENDKWRNYCKEFGIDSHEKILIYHWRDNDKDEFSMFFKTKKTVFYTGIFILALLCLIIISMISSVLIDLFYAYVLIHDEIIYCSNSELYSKESILVLLIILLGLFIFLISKFIYLKRMFHRICYKIKSKLCSVISNLIRKIKNV